MNGADQEKDKIFRLIQRFLENHPVIVWGSGATIPYGLPGMSELVKVLKPYIGEIAEDADLETELGKLEDDSQIDKIRIDVREAIFKKDRICLEESIKDSKHFSAVIKMVKKFYDAHPRKVDILTTNYDCVLEYALSGANYDLTDGFTGRSLSTFAQKHLEKERDIVNIIKVHGSLNWFSDGSNRLLYLPHKYESSALTPVMILPSDRKYRESYREPYRTLITKSDELIEKAESFLVVGFGFRDDHITPKVEKKIESGTPIVIITKKATGSCKRKLERAEKYILLEKSKSATKITFKSKESSSPDNCQLQGDYWKLEPFFTEVL